MESHTAPKNHFLGVSIMVYVVIDIAKDKQTALSQTPTVRFCIMLFTMQNDIDGFEDLPRAAYFF